MTTHPDDVSVAVDMPVAEPVTDRVPGTIPPAPPPVPIRPLDGGRDAFATHARSLRRLEARALGERRQAGEDAVGRLASASGPYLDATEDDVRAPSMPGRLRTTIDAVLRRAGRARQP